MILDTALFFLFRKKVRILAQKSLLWNMSKKENSLLRCHICEATTTSNLITFPLGWPMPQNDHLLYFNLQEEEEGFLLKNRAFIEKTLGFLISVPWLFCHSCKNASLGIILPQNQFDCYYSKYYQRLFHSSLKRKNTKEQHGRYIDYCFEKRSVILEVGAAEGYVARYLAEQGHSVFVIEPSFFKSNFFNHPNITVLKDLDQCKAASLDGVYLHHVFEHIFEPSKFLKKLKQLLKPGGKCIIQIPDLSLQIHTYLESFKKSHFSFFNRVQLNDKVLNAYFSKGGKKIKWMDAFANNHVSAFTPEGLQKIFELQGFDIDTICQTTADRLVMDSSYAWPIDYESGQTPNGLTLVAVKRDH